MPAITMLSERTGPWAKMRQPIALFSGSGISSHTRSLADFITTTSGFRFLVHTPIDTRHDEIVLVQPFDFLGAPVQRQSRALTQKFPVIFKIQVQTTGPAAGLPSFGLRVLEPIP